MSMDTSYNSSTGRFIPPELCACIIESAVLTQQDLHALVAVSRSFWQETERHLYRRPSLQNKAKIKGFCINILRRPHLAERIYKLVLYMPPQMDFQAADLSRITRTLHLAVNLKFLDVFREGDKKTHWLYPRKGDALQTWVLEDHEFKLKAFRNSYFNQQALRTFILSQPDLEILAMDCDGDVDLEFVPLPKLKLLSCSVAAMHEFCITEPGSRRKIGTLMLKNVNSSREADMRMIEDLIHFRDTLKLLDITKYATSGEGLDIHELVLAVAARTLPALKFLQVTDFRYMDGYSDLPFGAFLLLFPFIQLEALGLCPSFKRSDQPSTPATDSFYSELNTDVGRLAVATRIMKAIPTLKRLGLATPRYKYFYDRTVSGDGPCVKLIRETPTTFVAD